MVTSLYKRQETNWKDSAQIYEDVSRTKEIAISSKTGMSETGLLKNEELVQI